MELEEGGRQGLHFTIKCLATSPAETYEPFLDEVAIHPFFPFGFLVQTGLDADYEFSSDTQICGHSLPGPVVSVPGTECRTPRLTSLLLLLRRVPSVPVDVQNSDVNLMSLLCHFIAGKAGG